MIRILTAVCALAVLAACEEKAAAPAAGAGADAAALKTENESLKADIAKMQLNASTQTAPHADAGPAVYFVNLKDGDTVTSPVRVVFGLYGLGVAPAGTEKEKTGHHHLLIDTELTPEEMKFAIPNDDQHKHFGGGQTEAVVELKPGAHTLQLVFGDLHHELMKPPVMSPKITVTVK